MYNDGEEIDNGGTYFALYTDLLECGMLYIFIELYGNEALTYESKRVIRLSRSLTRSTRLLNVSVA